MGTQPGAQTLGHREGDEVVGHRQQFELLALDPLGGIGLPALRTGPMVAGMIDKMSPLAVDTLIDLSPQSAGAAGQDGLNRPAMGGKHLSAKLPEVGRPMPP